MSVCFETDERIELPREGVKEEGIITGNETQRRKTIMHAGSVLLTFRFPPVSTRALNLRALNIR